jgi:hypothetical protein
VAPSGRVVDANRTSTLLTLKAVLPGMVERCRSAVVTMASIASRLLDIPWTSFWTAAKAGIVQLTRHVAMEVGPYKDGAPQRNSPSGDAYRAGRSHAFKGATVTGPGERSSKRAPSRSRTNSGLVSSSPTPDPAPRLSDQRDRCSDAQW